MRAHPAGCPYPSTSGPHWIKKQVPAWVFAQGVLMGLVISQFSTFLDHVDRDSRGLVALAAFVTVAALYVVFPY